LILAIVLTLLGLGFILAEVFFPSLGLLGLMAGACILAADLFAFDVGDGVGWTFVVAQVLLIPTVVWLGFKALPHLAFGRRMLLTGPATTPGPGLPDLSHLVGRRGQALTDLRPAGMARFGDERVSVVALGGMIDRETELTVVAVEGAEIRVRAADAPDPSASSHAASQEGGSP
jgi:membrane-bound serine protease (ClpP class)